MKKLYEVICEGEVFLIKVFLVFFVALIFLAAATRYMGYPINWSVDIAVCLFAWCTFLPQAKSLVTLVLVLKLATKNKEKIES